MVTLGSVRLSGGKGAGVRARPVKGRAAGPPIRLGRPHPGGDPEVDATWTSRPSPLKPLTGHPHPRPAPTPQPNARRRKGRLAMTGKQNQVIPGLYRQHILAGVIIAGQQPVRIDTHGGGTGAEGSHLTATFGQQLMNHPVRPGRRDRLQPGLARAGEPVGLQGPPGRGPDHPRAGQHRTGAQRPRPRR